jgi:hypothetical protein
VEKVPELLEALLKNAADMAKKITEKSEEVDLLTAGINSVIDPPPSLKATQHVLSPPSRQVSAKGKTGR